MAFNDLSENFEGLNKSTQEFVEKNYEYYKLSIFKTLTKGTSSMVLFMSIGAVLFGAMLLLTFAMALFIGAWLDNLGLGFLILGGIYLIIALVAYYGFRKTIERKILIKASKDFFDFDD
ncbi:MULTISPECIES: phage holin family protein [Galbibacter]|uniref:Phage holin family protein n=1 Tax=Galbibacter pacificus TaxID=2996052 RepID=A0ABT6FWK3_9FLAO|nr:phage holin family protein [Galbibacter pacificus]MDG3584177.1 phage holin family protein [Galbibacter pacificus]MDG3587642.1 phage holin family protein [Galbibacter pacificus]